MSDKAHNTRAVSVIGAGFAGLSASAYLARAGCDVTVFEKHDDVGGRARQLRTQNGYLFDMGPSWYWMPGVFERFFADFGHTPADFYRLQALDPQYVIVFGEDDEMQVPGTPDELSALFESIEPGSSKSLAKFLKEAAYKYDIGVNKLVYKPGLSLLEFADKDLLRGMFRLQVFTSLRTHIRKHFRHAKLRALMEFPALFLGAVAENTPALYSLMNYAGLQLGTWYPQGGFGAVVNAMRTVAEAQGVKFRLGEPVTGFSIGNRTISHLHTSQGDYETSGIIGAADYHHIDSDLLPAEYSNYSRRYWDDRTMAPSALIFYLGVNKRVSRLKHHNLFFDEDLDTHAREIYERPQWPSKPLFYVCCPSKTDAGVAPEGHENLFILMPLAVKLNDSETVRQRYFEQIMDRLERYCGEAIRPHIDYQQSYCVSDFVNDYHSYGGNAYGLANTLGQTAILKPAIRSKKISNLFFAGHLTVPGPGVPPALISGKVASDQLLRFLTSNS